MTNPNALARAQAAHLAAEVSDRTGVSLEVAMKLVAPRTPAEQVAAEHAVGMPLNEALTYVPGGSGGHLQAFDNPAFLDEFNADVDQRLQALKDARNNDDDTEKDDDR